MENEDTIWTTLSCDFFVILFVLSVSELPCIPLQIPEVGYVHYTNPNAQKSKLHKIQMHSLGLHEMYRMHF